MERKFNTRLTEIKNIGDELRFQREYYNFKNSPYKFIRRTHIGEKSTFVGDKLKEYLENNFATYKEKDKYNSRDNFGEYGTGENVIYGIENLENKEKNGESDPFYPERYYLRMYSLLKIYGFLDDYNILMLLKKYNIAPDFEKSKIEVKKIIESCKKQYEDNPLKRLFNFKTCYIAMDKDYEKLRKEIIGLNSIENKSHSHLGLMDFSNVKKLLIEKFSNLSQKDRKCKSLELGQETNFANDVIENKIEYITYETLLKIIDYLDLQNTDFNFLINKKINAIDKNIKLKMKIDILGLDKILS